MRVDVVHFLVISSFGRPFFPHPLPNGDCCWLHHHHRQSQQHQARSLPIHASSNRIAMRPSGDSRLPPPISDMHNFLPSIQPFILQLGRLYSRNSLVSSLFSHTHTHTQKSLVLPPNLSDGGGGRMRADRKCMYNK